MVQKHKVLWKENLSLSGRRRRAPRQQKRYIIGLNTVSFQGGMRSRNDSDAFHVT